MAAPTPSPMIAVSEIGVSRTRSPNRSRESPGEPEDVAPGPDVDAGDEHPVVLGELGLERRRGSASMVRNTGASSPAGRRLRRAPVWPARRSRSTWRRPGRRAGGPPRRRRRAPRPPTTSSALISSSPTPASRSRRFVREQRVTGLPRLDLVRRSVALGIAFVVAVPAVGRGLDHGGTPARARRQHHVLHRRMPWRRRRCRRPTK